MSIVDGFSWQATKVSGYLAVIGIVFPIIMSSQEQKINNLLEQIRQEQITRSTAMSGNQESTTSRSNGDLPVVNRPSLELGINNTSTRRRPQELSFTTRNNDNLETDRRLKEIMKISGNLTINNKLYKTDIKDMEDIEELGNGTCGHVVKMRHKPSGEIIAVKQMRRSGNSEDNKRIIMDIEVILKSHDCKYIVQCLGCFITDSEVWICMELMTTCFDKLLKRLGHPIPEEILGKVTVATVEALSYLKDKHGVIHRDVKPSNILLDTKGFVKLCDFGISGRLKDSMAQTRSTGCAAYLAPERIEPDPKNPDYDIRADVWSLGITLVELATGVFPYQDCKTDFEVLTKVLGQDPPTLPDTFSIEFRDFVKACLIKDKNQRPKYAELKNHNFIKKYETENVNVGDWVVKAFQQADRVPPRHSTPQSSIRRFFTSHQRQSHDSHPPQLAAQYPSNLMINGNSQCQYRQLEAPTSKLNYINKSEPLQCQQPIKLFNTHQSRLSTFQSNQRDLASPPLLSPPKQPPPPPPPSLSPPPPPPPPPATQTKTAFLQQKYQSYSPFQAYQNHITAKKISQQTKTDEPLQQQQQQQQHEEQQKKIEVETRFNSPILQRRYENFVNSPYQQRRVASEGRWRSPSASPLPLRSQYQCDEEKYNCGNTSPIILQRFYHQQKQQQLVKEAEESGGKKRFASYIKLQLSGDRSGRSSRHQSPEPPPRLNRTISGENQSPLAAHRSFLESSNSPSPSRRYISPTPPVPPPRRIPESNSVPGSPQHIRARFHYTPEPQRRLFHNNDVS